MKLGYKIGVFGSAIGVHSKEEKEKARSLGREIANRKCVVVTGATFGLPNEAVLGARDEGGFCLGISPAYSKQEHIEKYKMPLDDDVTVFTGLGFQGRNLINVRSSDGTVFIKGSIGTLNELTVAVKEEKVIGILEGTGGVCDGFRKFVEGLELNFHPQIIYSNDPIQLIEKVVEALKNG